MKSIEVEIYSLLKPCLRAVALGCALFAGCPAFANPLDKDACAGLSQEFQNLKALDVDKFMEKGPEWAVSNLSQSDLNLVRRFIEVDEQIKFRCMSPSALVHFHNPIVDEDEEIAAKPENDSKAKPVLKPKGHAQASSNSAIRPVKKTQIKVSNKVAKPLQARNGVKAANTGAQ